MCAHVKNKRGYRASLAFFTFLLPSDLPLRLVGRAPVSTITSDFTSPENSPSFVPIPYFSCHSRVSWPHSPFSFISFFSDASALHVYSYTLYNNPCWRGISQWKKTYACHLIFYCKVIGWKRNGRAGWWCDLNNHEGSHVLINWSYANVFNWVQISRCMMIKKGLNYLESLSKS